MDYTFDFFGRGADLWAFHGPQSAGGNDPGHLFFLCIGARHSLERTDFFGHQRSARQRRADLYFSGLDPGILFSDPSFFFPFGIKNTTPAFLLVAFLDFQRSADRLDLADSYRFSARQGCGGIEPAGAIDVFGANGAVSLAIFADSGIDVFTFKAAVLRRIKFKELIFGKIASVFEAIFCFPKIKGGKNFPPQFWLHNMRYAKNCRNSS